MLLTRRCQPASLGLCAHSPPYPPHMETTTERVPTLTKKDVARRVSDLIGEPLYKCEPWVQSVIESIRELMEEADPEVRIELRDFGVFEVKKTKAKPKARNPKTNETVFIPSRRKTHFKPSKRLRSELQKPLSDLGYEIPEGSADHPAQRRAA
ncbi:MAG: HU family DNA-binding protein [Rubricoccaceae bacterium]